MLCGFDASDLVAYGHILPNHNFLPIGVASGGRKAKVVVKNNNSLQVTQRALLKVENVILRQ